MVLNAFPNPPNFYPYYIPISPLTIISNILSHLICGAKNVFIISTANASPNIFPNNLSHLIFITNNSRKVSLWFYSFSFSIISFSSSIASACSSSQAAKFLISVVSVQLCNIIILFLFLLVIVA